MVFRFKKRALKALFNWIALLRLEIFQSNFEFDFFPLTSAQLLQCGRLRKIQLQFSINMLRNQHPFPRIALHITAKYCVCRCCSAPVSISNRSGLFTLHVGFNGRESGSVTPTQCFAVLFIYLFFARIMRSPKRCSWQAIKRRTAINLNCASLPCRVLVKHWFKRLIRKETLT